MKLVKVTEEECLHLLEISAGRTITLAFGPKGVWVYDQTERWVLKELIQYRGIKD